MKPLRIFRHNLAGRLPSAFLTSAFILLMLLLFMALPRPATAQTAAGPFLRLLAVNDTQYPQVSLALDARSDTGAPLGNLNPENLTLQAAGTPIGNFEIQSNTTLGLDVVLVLDRSTDAANWAATQAIVEGIAGLLRPQDRLAVTAFSDDVIQVQDFTDDFEAAVTALAQTAPQGQFSAAYPAMLDAVDRLAALNSARGVVIVLADAPDNISQQSAADVLAASQATGYSVAVASYGQGQAVDAYDQIAALSGGRRAAAATIDALAQPLTQWVSSYLPAWTVVFDAPVAGDNQSYPLVLAYTTAAGQTSVQGQFTAQLREVSVELVGLAAGQPVAGVFDLVVEASVPGTVEQVVYRIDGQAVGAVDTLTPFAWDTTLVEPGTRLVEVVVTDSAGNEGTAAVEVQVVRPAPRLTVLDVNAAEFPVVAVAVDAYGTNGLPLVGLDGAAFTVEEDGNPVAGPISVGPADDQPLGLVVVLDRSVSVADWAQLRAATNTLIDNLRPGDEIALYAFGSGATLIQAVTANHGAAKAALAGVEAQPPTSGTPPADSNALYAALLDAVNQAGIVSHPRRAVIAVTDGLDATGTLSVGELSAVLAGQNIPVHLLGFGGGIQQPGLFAGLAQLTGGNAATVNSAADVRTALQTLGTLLQSGYRLTYSSTVQADNASHAVSVTLNAQGARAEAVGSFVAVPGEVVVTIPAIAPGETIAGSVDLTAQAQSPAPVQAVVYRLNGEVLAEVDDLDFTIMWNSDTVAPGNYTLDVTVTDIVGNVGTASVDFVVVPPLTLAVDFAAPGLAQGVEVGERVDLSIAVDLAPGTNSNVQVEAAVDGRIVSTDDRAPYQISFGTSDLAPGDRVITVVARNADGYQAVQELPLMLVAPAVETGGTPVATGDSTAAADVGFWARIFGSPQPTPVPVSPATAPVASDTSIWTVLRWIAILLVLAALVGFLYWLFGLIRRSRRERKLTPVRMVLTNTGNASTAYLLRGEDEEQSLSFQFWLNGHQLGLPPVARLEPAGPAPAAMGQSRYAPTPVQPQAAPVNGQEVDEYGEPYGDEYGEGGGGMGGSLAGAGGRVQEAGAVAAILATILTSVAMFLPRGLSRPVRQVAMTLRRGTMLTRRVGHVQRQVGRLNKTQMGSQMVQKTQEGATQLGEVATSDATRQAVVGAGRTAQGAMVAGAGAGAATAQRQANRLYDLGGALTQARTAAAGAAGVAAGAVSNATGVLTGSANRQWVYVPQVQPGETVTIDIMVGGSAKSMGTRHYPFRLVSRALEDESGAQVVEEASVRIQGAAWWQRNLGPILGVLGLLLAVLAALIWFS